MVSPLPLSSSPTAPLPSGSHSGFFRSLPSTILLLPQGLGTCSSLLSGTLFFVLIRCRVTPSLSFTLHPKLYFFREASAHLPAQLPLFLKLSPSPANLAVLAPLATATLHFVW